MYLEIVLSPYLFNTIYSKCISYHHNGSALNHHLLFCGGNKQDLSHQMS